VFHRDRRAGEGLTSPAPPPYRSFTYSKTEVRTAACKRWSAADQEDQDEKSGDDTRSMADQALKIYITLTAITPRSRKYQSMRIWLMKEQTVSAEILIQMNQFLEHV